MEDCKCEGGVNILINNEKSERGLDNHLKFMKIFNEMWIGKVVDRTQRPENVSV